jgi:hypothetical protein
MGSQIENKLQITTLERISISMAKRTLSTAIILPVLLALAACSSLKLTGAVATSSQNQSNPQSSFSSQPLEDKLAIGTLKLEGTGQAVSAAQAKTLLPLWKAVKTLSASNTTAAAEMTALYSQIQDAMTAQQIQAIKDLNPSPSDLQALMKLGSQPAKSAAQSSSQASSAQFQGGPGGGDPGGGPGGAGGPPPDAGGGIPGTGLGAGLQITTTPVAGKSGAANRSSMNLMFVDSVIQLLTQRASS